MYETRQVIRIVIGTVITHKYCHKTMNKTEQRDGKYESDVNIELKYLSRVAFQVTKKGDVFKSSQKMK